MPTPKKQSALDKYDKEEKRLLAILGSPVLAKACMDTEFDYALKLRTGEIIEFDGAKYLNKDWIQIAQKQGGTTERKLPYPAPRGVNVRISDIVWVMDAPIGS